MLGKVLIVLVGLLTVSQSFAQQQEEITPKNSWLKAGVSASIPVGDVADYSAFAAGLELSGQVMATKKFGLGLATGYTHFFAKENADGFGTIPVGLLLRFYPQAEGFFAGADVGYTILTKDNNPGGIYIKPQLGYHNYNWNFYGFYNHVFRKEGYIDIQNAGVAATYNIRFK